MGDAFAGSAAFADSALTVLRVLLLASFHLVRVGVRDTDRDRDIVRVRVRVRERVRVRWAILHRAASFLEISEAAGEPSRASARIRVRARVRVRARARARARVSSGEGSG